MKPIILLTKPHTGTHTVIYLLGMLGDAEIYHNHVSGEQSLRTIRKTYELMPNAVYLYTLRHAKEYEEGWFHRYKDENAQRRFDEVLSTEKKMLGIIDAPRTHFLNINGTESHRLGVLQAVCDEAEVEYTRLMKKFTRRWPRLNSSRDGEFELSEERKDQLEHLKADAQLGEHLRKAYGYDVNKGVRHGT